MDLVAPAHGQRAGGSKTLERLGPPGLAAPKVHVHPIDHILMALVPTAVILQQAGGTGIMTGRVWARRIKRQAMRNLEPLQGICEAHGVHGIADLHADHLWLQPQECLACNGRKLVHVRPEALVYQELSHLLPRPVLWALKQRLVDRRGLQGPPMRLMLPVARPPPPAAAASRRRDEKKVSGGVGAHLPLILQGSAGCQAVRVGLLLPGLQDELQARVGREDRTGVREEAHLFELREGFLKADEIEVVCDAPGHLLLRQLQKSLERHRDS